MNVTAAGWEPNQFVLRTGVPVKWVIDGQQITSCNSAIKVPSLGLQFNIKKGLQTVEFTPTEAGNIQWSCWMGMIKGVFVVKDGVDPQNQAQLQQALASAPPLQRGGGSCGMMSGGGGGCGCGMMGG
jgi:plastocyanin domain-containing protein